MNWKYFIHHTWPEERTEWAEAFVRPDDPAYTGDSLWVTIDCRDLGREPFRVVDRQDDDADLLVNARDFTRAEFLEWMKVWLRAKGFTVTDLVPAALEEFVGTHAHADFLFRLATRE